MKQCHYTRVTGCNSQSRESSDKPEPITPSVLNKNIPEMRQRISTSKEYDRNPEIESSGQAIICSCSIFHTGHKTVNWESSPRNKPRLCLGPVKCHRKTEGEKDRQSKLSSNFVFPLKNTEISTCGYVVYFISFKLFALLFATECLQSP